MRRPCPLHAAPPPSCRQPVCSMWLEELPRDPVMLWKSSASRKLCDTWRPALMFYPWWSKNSKTQPWIGSVDQIVHLYVPLMDSFSSLGCKTLFSDIQQTLLDGSCREGLWQKLDEYKMNDIYAVTNVEGNLTASFLSYSVEIKGKQKNSETTRLRTVEHFLNKSRVLFWILKRNIGPYLNLTLGHFSMILETTLRFRQLCSGNMNVILLLFFCCCCIDVCQSLSSH